MIRFRCPNCQRDYVLADAMFGLPLVCKGCGHHLKVPPPGTDEIPDDSAARGAALPGENALPPIAATPVPPAPPIAHTSDSGNPQPILSPEMWAKLDAPPPPAPPEPKPWGAVSPAPTPAPRAERKALGRVVDVAVALVLLVVGAFVGEFLVRKPTREVLEGLAAPKFPPTDLLLWLAAPAVLLLGYALLGSRGKSLGGWLKRRA